MSNPYARAHDYDEIAQYLSDDEEDFNAEADLPDFVPGENIYTLQNLEV